MDETNLDKRKLGPRRYCLPCMVPPWKVEFWNHCVKKQKDHESEVSDYKAFFETCVGSFLALDQVKVSRQITGVVF